MTDELTGQTTALREAEAIGYVIEIGLELPQDQFVADDLLLLFGLAVLSWGEVALLNEALLDEAHRRS